jgi:hypothetical protein
MYGIVLWCAVRTGAAQHQWQVAEVSCHGPTQLLRCTCPINQVLLLLSRYLAAYRFSSRYDQPDPRSRTAQRMLVTTNWWLELLCVDARQSPPAHLAKVRNDAQLAQQHAFPGLEPVARRGRAGIRWCHGHTEGNEELERSGRVHWARTC